MTHLQQEILAELSFNFGSTAFTLSDIVNTVESLAQKWENRALRARVVGRCLAALWQEGAVLRTEHAEGLPTYTVSRAIYKPPVPPADHEANGSMN